MKFMLSKIFSKRGMICVNIIITLIALFSIYSSAVLFFNTSDDTARLDDTLDALAAILVAYGVALEERDVIFELFKLDGRTADAAEKKSELTHLSHSYGGVLVVLGLMVEVMIEFLKIPAHIVDLKSFENPLFLIGLVFCALSIQSIAKFTSRLVKADNSL